MAFLSPFSSHAETPSDEGENNVRDIVERTTRDVNALREERAYFSAQAAVAETKADQRKFQKSLKDNRQLIVSTYDRGIRELQKTLKKDGGPCVLMRTHGKISAMMYGEWNAYGFSEPEKKGHLTALQASEAKQKQLATACLKDWNAGDKDIDEARRILTHAPSYIADNGRYAALVMDLKTGDILHNENGDEKRFPASLTKMMTMYILFDALRDGLISLNDDVVVTKEANDQQRSHLLVKTGDSIKLSTAMESMMVLSANNIAFAAPSVYPGGAAAFIQQMNQKAADIGISAHFENTTGLHDPAQTIPAHDVAVLMKHLRHDHPDLFAQYFSLRSMKYKGNTIPGHNPLLKKECVEGGKTGFIDASGFNIAFVCQTEDKELAIVVMGGDTAPWRNERAE